MTWDGNYRFKHITSGKYLRGTVVGQEVINDEETMEPPIEVENVMPLGQETPTTQTEQTEPQVIEVQHEPEIATGIATGISPPKYILKKREKTSSVTLRPLIHFAVPSIELLPMRQTAFGVCLRFLIHCEFEPRPEDT